FQAVKRCAGPVVVVDGEVQVRVSRGDGVRRVGEQEAGRNNQVGLLANRRREVGDVVRGRVRLERQRLHAELGLRLVEPFLLRLVEGAVVELADVADQGDQLAGAAGGGLLRGGSAV